MSMYLCNPCFFAVQTFIVLKLSGLILHFFFEGPLGGHRVLVEKYFVVSSPLTFDKHEKVLKRRNFPITKGPYLQVKEF